MQKLNVRIVSFFLILAFSQKMGLELWLHNWLHETTVAASVSSAHKGRPVLQHLQIRCNCIDDALNPIVESGLIVYNANQQPSIPIFAAIYSSWLSVDTAFPALRGPPAASISL
jgi:hypothetical protein